MIPHLFDKKPESDNILHCQASVSTLLEREHNGITLRKENLTMYGKNTHSFDYLT